MPVSRFSVVACTHEINSSAGSFRPSSMPASRACGEAYIGVSLGRRIRAARTAKKLSMRALAGAAEISQPFLSQIEGGRTMPSILTLFKLAKVLDISPSELLPANEEPEPVHVVRRGEGELVPVSESDDGAVHDTVSARGFAVH